MPAFDSAGQALASKLDIAHAGKVTGSAASPGGMSTRIRLRAGLEEAPVTSKPVSPQAGCPAACV